MPTPRSTGPGALGTRARSPAASAGGRHPEPGAVPRGAAALQLSGLRVKRFALKQRYSLYKCRVLFGFVFTPELEVISNLMLRGFEAQRRGLVLCASEVSVNSGFLFLTGSQDVPRLPEAQSAGWGRTSALRGRARGVSSWGLALGLRRSL